MRRSLLHKAVMLLLLAALGCSPLRAPLDNSEVFAPETVAATERHQEMQQSVELLRSVDATEEGSNLPCPPELSEEEDANAGNGFSLEACIDRLIAGNGDLAALFQDIPKARADVLTAGLRNDPVLFLSASPIPYGRFSQQRPGATQYDITIVQPLDLNGKHRANRLVAQKMIPVLEARYQDAVRRKIDALYNLYVNVLEARASLSAARANLQQLSEAAEKGRDLARQQKIAPTALARVALRQAGACIAVQRGEAASGRARHNLASFLEIPFDEADCLHVRGALRDRFPPPPCTEELIQLALRIRPDLAALRFSVERADAQIRRARVEGLDDFFLFYSPYQATDFSPQNRQSTTSWEIGILLPTPIFNRNQGEIARARANEVQWRIELEKQEHEVIDEVTRAAAEYADSRTLVRRYEQEVLPGVREICADRFRQFADGEKEIGALLSAQKDQDEVVRRYLEALVRHRRSMLRLNTAVGQRILP